MADYGGGIGGKLRKRPLRRAAATPYDRPPAALRGTMAVHVTDPAAEGSGGWMSKLVDPASRLISTGASRFFSSVFRRRLPAPPPPLEDPDVNHHSRQDAPELPCTVGTCEVPTSELQKEEGRDNMRNNSENDGIAELEQLLRQKTFTRVEFDRLAELLRSRTVEPFKVETEVNNEKQCHELQQECFNSEKEENINVSAKENRIGSSKVHESLVVPQDSLTDQSASPAELAKVYMGTRPSKAPSSAVSLCNQVFTEDGKFPSIPSASKARDLSVAPRSTIRFSGIPEQTENGYHTPRTLGRSAMYRMSRSPYFKVNSINTVKGVELNEKDYTYMSLSQWTPKSSIRSGGKQVLKRGSAVLDGDFGSVGPIRRIRQKCNLNSPSKDSCSPISRSLLSSPLTPLSKEVIEGSTSVRKPDICKSRYGTTFSQAGGNGISNASVAPFPSRSSQTAHKLLQQLDKLLPSPKERSSEMETIERNEFPSKLTFDMLHGKARRSMEEIDTSKFSSMRGSDKLCTADDSYLPTPRSFSSGKIDMVEENGCSKSATLEVKLVSETNGVKVSTLSSDANSGKRCTYTLVSDSSVPPQSEKPGYHMCGPEGSLELDDEEYIIRNLASPLTKGKDVAESKIPESQNIISESGILEAALKIPKKNNLVSKTSATETKLKKPNHKEVVTETSTLERAQQPPEPSLPTPLLNQLASQKEQTSPVLSSGSNTANDFAFPSTTAAGSEMRHATMIAAEGSNLSKAGETQKAGDLFKPIGNAVSSGLSMSTTPALFAFGNSTTPSLSNGSPGSSSTPFSVSSTPGITQSGTPASSIPTSVTVGVPNTSPSLSSSAPVFSTVPSLQFGSGTTNASIPTPLDKTNSPVLEAEPARTSFISNSSAQGTSLFASMSSSSSTTTFTFSSSGSAPSALMTAGISSSKTSSSSALVTSSLFSSTRGSSSSLAPSSLFPSTGSSIFGFSGSSQSSSLSSSLANSSAQKSPTAFGATGGSIFGTQATHSGNGTSPISQSSTAHVTSFSSSPTFGLGNSSSSSFVMTPVGSATSGAKPFAPNYGFPNSAAASSSASTSSSFMPSGSGSSPFTFGSSSSSVFSFSSASSTASLTTSSSQPAFGLANPAIGFSSATPASPGNDQMNVEDNMTDITNQAPSLAFGQPGNQPTPNFAFGFPAVQPGGPSVFQFGSHQSSSLPQNPSPFQATGNSEFSQGGSFSLGSGGGDKSGRRIVKVARNKHRKK